MSREPTGVRDQSALRRHEEAPRDNSYPHPYAYFARSGLPTPAPTRVPCLVGTMPSSRVFSSPWPAWKLNWSLPMSSRLWGLIDDQRFVSRSTSSRLAKSLSSKEWLTNTMCAFSAFRRALHDWHDPLRTKGLEAPSR